MKIRHVFQYKTLVCTTILHLFKLRKVFHLSRLATVHLFYFEMCFFIIILNLRILWATIVINMDAFNLIENTYDLIMDFPNKAVWLQNGALEQNNK